MRRYILFVVGTIFLGACAGNPPAWWNPGNVYSTPKENKPVEQPLPSEQSISLQDESYEEMVLTPLQDEEEENDSGESSSQTLPQTDLLIPSVLE